MLLVHLPLLLMALCMLLCMLLAEQCLLNAHEAQQLDCCRTDRTILQAHTKDYNSTWRSAPSASHSGFGIAPPSSKAASALGRQTVSKDLLDQRLLPEDVMRCSGVSGPLGLGVVMQSECCPSRIMYMFKLLSSVISYAMVCKMQECLYRYCKVRSCHYITVIIY